MEAVVWSNDNLGIYGIETREFIYKLGEMRGHSMVGRYFSLHIKNIFLRTEELWHVCLASWKSQEPLYTQFQKKSTKFHRDPSCGMVTHSENGGALFFIIFRMEKQSFQGREGKLSSNLLEGCDWKKKIAKQNRTVNRITAKCLCH